MSILSKILKNTGYPDDLSGDTPRTPQGINDLSFYGDGRRNRSGAPGAIRCQIMGDVNSEPAYALGDRYLSKTIRHQE